MLTPDRLGLGVFPAAERFVPGLQQRADASPAAQAAHQRAANGAVFQGKPVPPRTPMPSPARLHELVQTYQAHQRANNEYRARPKTPGPDEDTRPPAGLLTTVAFDRLVHELFGLIGHALDVELSPHADIAAPEPSPSGVSTR
ncbi:hypothetical protein ACN6LM_006582 [Streptomyces sp. SAS_281]|uniref:hypothetical protein n=1 Tax=Streptomyces sp. SAS_281 TaxID=3412744 RepID=UPI00403D530E